MSIFILYTEFAGMYIDIHKVRVHILILITQIYTIYMNKNPIYTIYMHKTPDINKAWIYVYIYEIYIYTHIYIYIYVYIYLLEAMMSPVASVPPDNDPCGKNMFV